MKTIPFSCGVFKLPYYIRQRAGYHIFHSYKVVPSLSCARNHLLFTSQKILTNQLCTRDLTRNLMLPISLYVKSQGKTYSFAIFRSLKFNSTCCSNTACYHFCLTRMLRMSLIFLNG